MAGFSQAEQFWSAVELAVAKLKFEPAQDAELGELAQAAGDEELAFEPWRAAATTGLLVASRKDGAPIYKAVWRWAEGNSPAFSAVVDALPTERAFEQRLAAAVPKKLQVSESMFITWLETMLRGMSVLSTTSSERLGTLVASQRWDRAANTLADFYSTRRRADLLPALRACSGLLGMFTRWRLGVFAPTVTEKWAALEDAACDLYPSGPDDEQLWSRAGGKTSDLPGGFQSGAARWHAALSSVRFGGRPKARELLFHMLKDFPDNEQLRLYASDTDIVGYR